MLLAKYKKLIIFMYFCSEIGGSGHAIYDDRCG